MSNSPVLVAPAAAVAALAAAVDGLADAEWWRLGDDELCSAVRDVETQQRRLDAARLGLTQEVEARGVAASRACTDTASWLAQVLRLRPGEAKARVDTAATLSRSMSATRLALEEGRITLDHARVITCGIGRLHPDVSDADRVDGEAFLIEQAQLMDAGQLAKVARALRAKLDPTTPDALARDEARQHQRRRFSLVEEGDGGWWCSGYLDGEGGRVLHAALDPLSGPRPTGADGPDLRSPAQRRADALVDLAQRMLAVAESEAGALPSQGGARPTVVVTIDYDALARRVSAAGFTDADTPLSAAAIRRLACDANLVPAVLGADATVLDLGRSVYAVPPALRRALILRDGGCAVPGCGRPATWCHAHHIKHWADGGITALSNLVLVCGYHHRRIHDRRLDVAMVNGRPRFTLPGGNTLIDEALEPWRIGLRRFDPARRPPDDEPA